MPETEQQQRERLSGRFQHDYEGWTQQVVDELFMEAVANDTLENRRENMALKLRWALDRAGVHSTGVLE